jgi:hypothetical protein
MTKLAVLLSDFVQIPRSSVRLSASERYLQMLEQWSASLPPSLRNFPDVDASRPFDEEEYASVSVHKIYYVSC